MVSRSYVERLLFIIIVIGLSMSLRNQIFILFFIVISGVFAFFVNNYIELKYRTSVYTVKVEMQKTLDDVAGEISNLIINKQTDSFYRLLTENLSKQKFSNIKLLAPNNNVLFARGIDDLKPKYKDNWIFKRVDFDSENLIESVVRYKDKKVATLTATINKPYVYNTAWLSSINWLNLIFVLYGSLIVVFLIFSYIFFRPIKQIKYHVARLAKQNYRIEKKLPLASDLRQITEDLNQASTKVRELFLEHNQISGLVRENAYKDPVTKLSNKNYFLLNLEKMLNSSEVGIGGAIVVLDIKDKHPNDILLSKISQELKEYSERDKKVFLVSYFGENTFGIIIKNVSRVKLSRVAENILTLFSPLHPKNEDLDFDVYVGVTAYQVNTFAEDLISQAMDALIVAKQKDRSSYSVYEKETLEIEFKYSRWKKHLKEVLQNKEVMLQFQPVYFYEQNGTLLFHNEVFVRIKGMNNEMLKSGNFLPVAFSEKLGSEFDKITVENVLDRIKESPESMQRYGINLSYQALANEKFLEWLDDTLKKFGEDARRLTFEFTEQIVKQHTFLFRKFINLVNKYHVQVGIDHFGCGFSSFDYLEDLNVAYIKVDGSYTKYIHKNQDNQTIIKTFVDVAHSRDILIFATCVEIAEERETINRLNVDGIQGYLIGQPT